MELSVVASAKMSPILSMIHTEFPNYHPLMSIARIAHDAEDAKELGLAFMCHKTIAKYVEPELKSLELKAPADEHRRVRVSLFDVVEAECVQLA